MHSSPLFVIDNFEKKRFRNFAGDITSSSEECIKWMKQLISTLNGYSTLIDLKYAKPSLLLDSSKSGHLLDVKKIIGYCVNAIGLHQHNPTNLLHSPKFFEITATIIVKIVFHILVILKETKHDNGRSLEFLLKSNVLGAPFYTLVCYCLYNPDKLGFSVEQAEVKSKLGQLMEEFLKTFKSASSVSVAKEAYTELSHHLKDKYQNIFNVNQLLISFDGIPHFIQTSRGLKQILRGSGEDLMYFVVGDKFLEVFTSHAFVNQANNPLANDFFSNIVDICLNHSMLRVSFLQDILVKHLELCIPLNFFNRE